VNTIPRLVIIEERHRMLVRGAADEQIARFIGDHVKIVVISDEAWERLDRVAHLGPRQTMPEDWKFGDSPFARLEAAGIK
jgi:hypothetical protein